MRSWTREPRGASSRPVPCDWYYHTPLRRAEEPGKAEAPPSPGLGAFGDPRADGSLGAGRRKWVRDTDSDYVRLARQGGRPDLLRHFTPTPPQVSPGPCAAPDWFSHPGQPPAAEDSRPRVSAIPEYMIHEEFKSDRAARYEPRRGPFDFDMKSVWQRDAEEKGNREKREGRAMQGEGSPGNAKEIKLPAITPRYPYRTAHPIAVKEFHGGSRLIFPPISAHKKNEPVNFSKLISNGYGEEWFRRRDWEKKNSQPNDYLLPNSEAPQAESTHFQPKDSLISHTEAPQPESTHSQHKDSLIPHTEASQPESTHSQPKDSLLPHTEASQPESTQTANE